jgi:hypothetical protein
MSTYKNIAKSHQILFKTHSVTISDQARVDGMYKGKSYPFCLPIEYSEQNLYPPIQENVIHFFKKHNIKWHDGHGEKPSNHLCDSQVCCVNFLFPFADKPSKLAALLRPIYPQIRKMLPVEDGLFVSFEWIGAENYLGEKVRGSEKRSRGANFTSADAIVIFEDMHNQRQIVLIEWKYTESYSPTNLHFSKNGTDRLQIYQHLVDESDCIVNLDLLPSFDALFYEPFYQFMRQQFLAAKMEQAHELGADKVSVLHICPEANKAFKKITSPALHDLGKSATEVWKKLLVDQEKFVSISTESLLSSFHSNILSDWKNYAQKRYRF